MKDHVAIVIKNEEGRILFIQRALTKKTLPGIWAFPSGTVEENENFLETAEREAFEELNLAVIPHQKFAELDLPEFGARLHFVHCSTTNIPKIKQPEEIAKIEWMTSQDFFNRFSDEEIGHGLIWLRQQRHLL